MGLSSHQSTKLSQDEWLTPPEIINDFGPFDLDPCSPIDRHWPTAKKHYTINDNGLLQNWDGFVWLNPPYGLRIMDWMNRMAMHNNGIVLIFARTETRHFFQYVWPIAKSIIFVKGRIYFYDVSGNVAQWSGGAPSCIIAYGDEADRRLLINEKYGKYVKL